MFLLEIQGWCFVRAVGMALWPHSPKLTGNNKRAILLCWNYKKTPSLVNILSLSEPRLKVFSPGWYFTVTHKPMCFFTYITVIFLYSTEKQEIKKYLTFHIYWITNNLLVNIFLPFPYQLALQLYFSKYISLFIIRSH